MEKDSCISEYTSKSAIQRVKDPLPQPDICNCCGSSRVSVEDHYRLYGKEFSDWPYVWFCQDCEAYVGMHPFTAIPLGTLADKKTREARKLCKPFFEELYQSGLMNRSEAYEKLAEKLNVSKKECHFGMFDIHMCERAKEASIELAKPKRWDVSLLNKLNLNKRKK